MPTAHVTATRRRLAGAALLAAGFAAIPAACGSSSKSSATTQQAVAATAAAATIAGPVSSAAPGSGASGAGQSVVPSVPSDRQIILTGTVDVEVADVQQASSTLRATMDGLGGQLSESKIDLNADIPTATLTFRVPPAKYDSAVSAASAVGTLRSENATSQDVTVQVADLDAKIASLQASVERIRSFMDKATTVADIASLENDLQTRQTELDGLTAQRRALADQVSLATLTVTLTSHTPPAQVVPTTLPPAKPDTGFSDALSAGWKVIVAFAKIIAVVAGFLLPFVPFAVIIVPVVIMVRRRSAKAKHVNGKVDAMSSLPTPNLGAATPPPAPTTTPERATAVGPGVPPPA